MSELTEFREHKDHFMAHDEQSPLTHEQQHDFAGLSYFEEDPGLKFEIEPEEDRTQEVVEMQTSTGDVASYMRWGRIALSVDGQSSELTLYRGVDDDELFLPFADATSGPETYGAGLYLEVQPVDGGKVVVDFNYAYNPYCAYNERWSCPITPPENRLRVPVRAGERNYK